MGLTIHYSVSFKGSAEELIKKVEAIRQKCFDLPFEAVSDISHTLYGKKEFQFHQDMQSATWYPNNTEENMKRALEMYKERGIDRELMIDYEVFHHTTKKMKPFETVCFGVWAGKGCEGTDFNFFKKRKIWNCRSFTKTQFAEQFVKCHLLVVKVLDLFKEQGFTVKVKDEGKYWKTRDLKVLGKEINDYTTMLTGIFGALAEKAKDSGMTIESPITQCENYVNIKDDKKNKDK